ncbi:MAG: mechanosensitive ion channel domain-containing protein [Acidobacteriota bacterium]
MSVVHYTTIVVVALAFLVAALAVRVARALVLRLLGTLDMVSAENRAAVDARAQQLIRAATLLTYAVAAAGSISWALSRLGVDEPRWNPRALSRWSLSHGVNIVIILVGGWVAIRAASLIAEHLQYKLSGRHTQIDPEALRRATTRSGVLTSVVTVSVAFVAVLMVLRELSIDVMPILTGAGIAGLAIGFGAQNLVRDIISGFFLIIEDQVRVGDIARINGVGGKVEQINLRTIVLRDGEGAVQVFPNGTVTALANLSKLFAYAIVDVRVAYSENLDRVNGTIREVGAAMALDPAWQVLVLEPIEFHGVESLADGLVTIRVRFKTAPLHQGLVANELRRRLLGTLAGRGIRPYAS